MAHRISEFDGQNTIAYFGDTPWHRLGQVIPADLRRNIEAVMKIAGLDWSVAKVPLYHAYDSRLDNKIVQNPYAYGVLRVEDGAILSSVGHATELVQNIEAFNIVNPLVNEFGFNIETAGALGNGSEVWLLLKAPQTFDPFPGDRHNVYVMLHHHHTNDRSTVGALVRERVVCANTAAIAVGEYGGSETDKSKIFRIRKTAGVRERIAEATEIVRGLAQTIERTKESYQQLAARKLSTDEIAQFIAGTFPLPTEPKRDDAGNVMRDDVNNEVIFVERESKVVTERRKKVSELIFTQPGAELAGANVATGEANAWSVLCALEHYFDHVRVAEAKAESAKKAALVSAAFGANNAAKLVALSKLRRMSMVAAG